MIMVVVIAMVVIMNMPVVRVVMAISFARAAGDFIGEYRAGDRRLRVSRDRCGRHAHATNIWVISGVLTGTPMGALRGGANEGGAYGVDERLRGAFEDRETVLETRRGENKKDGEYKESQWRV